MASARSPQPIVIARPMPIRFIYLEKLFGESTGNIFELGAARLALAANNMTERGLRQPERHRRGLLAPVIPNENGF